MRPTTPTQAPAAPAAAPFTLIELLTVLAVLSILFSTLIPSLVKGRERGRQESCVGNLKQLAGCLTLYADENDMNLPAPYINMDPNDSGYYANRSVRVDSISWDTWQDLNNQGMKFANLQCPTSPKWIEQPGWTSTYDRNRIVCSYSAYWGLNRMPSTVASPARILDSPLRLTDDATLALAGDHVWVSNELSGSAWVDGSDVPEYANHRLDYSKQTEVGEFRGSNQVFMDGHVAWMDRSRFPDFFWRGTSEQGGNATAALSTDGYNFSWYWVPRD